MTTPLQSRLGIAADVVARASALICLGYFARFALSNAQRHRDAIALLQLIDQALNVLFIVCARWPKTVDRRPHIVLLAAVTTFVPMVTDRGQVNALIPREATYALQVLGIAIQISAKLSLGRSFGLVPANRGVKTGGAYRLLRHPMYLGYIVAQLGVLLGLASLRNLLVSAGFALFLALRAFLEERLLAGSDDYRAYQSRVRWRMVPFIY